MTSTEVVSRYLQDAAAAERNFESMLTGFSRAGRQENVRGLFNDLAQETRRQHQRLESRLHALGGTPSTGKSALAHVFGFAPTIAQVGHTPGEKNTQHLMMTFAAAAGEMAMYQALANAASEAGDMETERLARELEQEERSAHERVWRMLPNSAARSFHEATERQMRRAMGPGAAERAITGIAGGMLAAYGMKKRGLTGALMTAAGGALLYSGAAGRSVKGVTGMFRGGEAPSSRAA